MLIKRAAIGVLIMGTMLTGPWIIESSAEINGPASPNFRADKSS